MTEIQRKEFSENLIIVSFAKGGDLAFVHIDSINIGPSNRSNNIGNTHAG